MDKSPLSKDVAERFLSKQRFATYLSASQGDPARALALYQWNTLASSVSMVPVAHTEVALRNTLDRELSKHYRSNWWFDNNPDLSVDTRETINETLEKLGSKRQ